MNKKITIPAMALSLLFSGSVAFAEETAVPTLISTKPEGIAEKTEQKETTLGELQAKQKEQRCQNAQTRIQTSAKRFENNQQMFTTVFGNMQKRLVRLSTHLSEKGLDTTQLNADLAILDQKIAKLLTDSATLVTGLKTSETLACGENQTELKGKVGEARKVFELLKQDRADIRDFFKTTIKADLKAIRAQLEKVAETSEATEEIKPVEEKVKTEKTKTVKTETETTETATTTPIE